MSNRRKIRETVLQALYASQLGDHHPEEVLQTIVNPGLKEDATGLAFAERLFLRSLDNLEQTDTLIRDHIANWDIGRLATVDRIILQMAITEFLTFEDIPTKVTINEAIEIAKNYSTAKSGRFVNGILDAVVDTLRSEDRIDKKGRGLQDTPARKPRKVSIPYVDEDGNPDPDASKADPEWTDSERPQAASQKKKRIKRPRKSPGS